MPVYKSDGDGAPLEINDRLILIRHKRKKTLEDISDWFHEDKSTVSLWEDSNYWSNVHSSIEKLILLMKLATFYECDFRALLSGKLGNTTKIMVIDSDATTRSVVEILLKRMLGDKTSIYPFKSTREALFSAQSVNADFILIDYKLHEENTIDFINRIESIQTE